MTDASATNANATNANLPVAGMTDDDLLAIARGAGTPAFVFDAAVFRARLRAVRGILGPDIELAYSIKANPFLIGAAEAEGLRLEVCSPGELAACEAWRVPAGRVIYSGVCKREADVREALAYGAGVFTAESPRQLELVAREAAAAGMTVPVLLRLSAGSQFGMSREDLLAIVDRRAALAGVRLVGIHYFVGTQRAKLKHQRRELEKLVALLDELEAEHGWRPERLEYGPGLAVPLFADEDFSDTLAPARELAPALWEVAGRVDLTVEMGRFLATECGVYLASVVDDKTDRGTRYVLVDGGINHLVYYGQTMAMKVPLVTNLTAAVRGADSAAPAATETPASTGALAEMTALTVTETPEVELCGSLCTTADVLVRSLPLTDPQVGDVLAFRNAGAYSVTEGIGLFLSRDLPAIVIRRGPGDWEVVRRSRPTWPINVPEAFASPPASAGPSGLSASAGSSAPDTL